MKFSFLQTPKGEVAEAARVLLPALKNFPRQKFFAPVIPPAGRLRVSVRRAYPQSLRRPLDLAEPTCHKGVRPMKYTLRVVLLLPSLSLSFVNPALTHSRAAANSPAASEVNEMAAALARAGSEDELKRLLVAEKGQTNVELLAALNARANPLMQKGDYAEALRVSRLAARLAGHGGDRGGPGGALHNIGVGSHRHKPATHAVG